MLNYSVIKLQTEQGKDSNLSKLLDCKLRHEKPPNNEIAASSPEFRHYVNYWDSIRVRDNLLHKQVMTLDGRIKWLLLVPKHLRKSVVDSMHNSVLVVNWKPRKLLIKYCKIITGLILDMMWLYGLNSVMCVLVINRVKCLLRLLLAI